MKRLSRDERIRLVMAEAIARDKAQREKADALRAKGSAGLPPRGAGGKSSSIVAKPRYR